MCVNPDKTQLLCVLGNTAAESRSYMWAGQSRVDRQESMALLGFSFGRRPNVDTHMALIKKKYTMRNYG